MDAIAGGAFACISLPFPVNPFPDTEKEAVDWLFEVEGGGGDCTVSGNILVVKVTLCSSSFFYFCFEHHSRHSPRAFVTYLVLAVHSLQCWEFSKL